jgi:hypothetical protein
MTGSFDFANPHTPEHRRGEAIVKLQSDRTGFGPCRIARMFSHYVPVQLDSNHVRARLDIQRVPIVLLQKIALGIFESVDAARRMRTGKRLLIWIS